MSLLYDDSIIYHLFITTQWSLIGNSSDEHTNIYYSIIIHSYTDVIVCK